VGGIQGDVRDLGRTGQESYHQVGRSRDCLGVWRAVGARGQHGPKRVGVDVVAADTEALPQEAGRQCPAHPAEPDYAYALPRFLN
jgi:hypothetical protein